MGGRLLVFSQVRSFPKRVEYVMFVCVCVWLHSIILIIDSQVRKRRYCFIGTEAETEGFRFVLMEMELKAELEL